MFRMSIVALLLTASAASAQQTMWHRLNDTGNRIAGLVTKDPVAHEIHTLRDRIALRQSQILDRQNDISRMDHEIQQMIARIHQLSGQMPPMQAPMNAMPQQQGYLEPAPIQTTPLAPARGGVPSMSSIAGR